MKRPGASRLHVGFFVSTYPTTSETFIWIQITSLLERGHRAVIFADRSRDEDRDPSVRDRYSALDPFVRYRTQGGIPSRMTKVRDVVSVLGCAIRHDLRALRLLRRGVGRRVRMDALGLLREQPMDVLHCHYGPLGVRAVAARAAAGLSVPIVVQFHGHDLSRHLRTYGPGVYTTLPKNVDIALPVAERWIPVLREIGFPPEKIVVHRVGIDSELFAPPEDRDYRPPLRLLSVCRLVPKKGLHIALRAIAGVLEDGRSATYTIVGDGPLRRELEELTRSLGIGGSVRFYGTLPSERVSELMAASHVFLAPSVTAADGDQEGTPTGVIEAMATGLPVIASRHSGIPELVVDGVTGWLVDEGDVSGLAAAITHACASTESALDDLAEMGERGRDRVLACFDIRPLTDRLEGLYLGVTGRSDA